MSIGTPLLLTLCFLDDLRTCRYTFGGGVYDKKKHVFIMPWLCAVRFPSDACCPFISFLSFFCGTQAHTPLLETRFFGRVRGAVNDS